jgi:glycosyltransferase involved in cell wall biosynthesis
MMPIRIISQFLGLFSAWFALDYSIPMKSSYLITVLIPCHSLRYLTNSIQSIARQTLSTEVFEVLLVADRIDLELAEDILAGSGLNFRIIESKQPGIVQALNLGLANITSEFVARMDEDDLMMPDRLELQYQYMQKNSEALVVGGQLQLIDVEGKAIGFANYRRIINKASVRTFESSPIAHPAAMFRRQAVERIGGYRNFLPEDWDLWVRLSQYGPIENLKEIVLWYRVHPNQLSREKMYAQQIGRQFVSTSFFARESGLRDAPTTNEDKSVWLEETQRQLRLVSPSFRRFEKRSQKSELINEALQKGKGQQRLYKVIFMLIKFPIVTSTLVMVQIYRKVRAISN